MALHIDPVQINDLPPDSRGQVVWILTTHENQYLGTYWTQQDAEIACRGIRGARITMEIDPDANPLTPPYCRDQQNGS